MAAQIKLRKLSGIKVGNDTIDTQNANQFASKVNALPASGKIVFAGQDYKGTFTTDNIKGTGKLELELERPENNFTIQGVKINTSGSHTLQNNNKDATIVLANTGSDKLNITEKDSGWFTTELTGTSTALKFGEWNDYDLPDKSYVDINFS